MTAFDPKRPFPMCEFQEKIGTRFGISAEAKNPENAPFCPILIPRCQQSSRLAQWSLEQEFGAFEECGMLVTSAELRGAVLILCTRSGIKSGQPRQSPIAVAEEHTMSKCLGFAAALLGLSALISVTNAAEIFPSVEEAETAQLNRNIAKNNADADQYYARQRDQYLQQKKQNDLLHEQYLAQMKEYNARNARYQEEKRKNDLLQEQFRKGGSSN